MRIQIFIKLVNELTKIMAQRNKHSVLKTFSITSGAIDILRYHSYVKKKSMSRLIEEAVRKNYKKGKVI